MFENRYGSVASLVYDLDKPIGHSFGDIEFYLALLKGVRGPVLEPAVGTGRLLVRLLKAGHDAEGFDASAEMLSICRENCVRHGFSPKLQKAFFEDFNADRAFGAIVLPAGSFHLITDFDAAMLVLERFRAHLAPGGRLLIDLSVANDLGQPKPRARHWVGDNGDIFTLLEHPAGLDAIAQTTTRHLRYDHWQSGKLVASEIDVFSMRWWGYEEFRLALRQAGFAKINVYADYNPKALPSRTTQTLTFDAT